MCCGDGGASEVKGRCHQDTLHTGMKLTKISCWHWITSNESSYRSTGTISTYCMIHLNQFIFLKKYLFISCEGVCACHTIGVVVRGQFSGVCSFLLPWGFWGSNSGHQALSQIPLPTKQPYWVQIQHVFKDTFKRRYFPPSQCMTLNSLYWVIWLPNATGRHENTSSNLNHQCPLCTRVIGNIKMGLHDCSMQFAG